MYLELFKASSLANGFLFTPLPMGSGVDRKPSASEDVYKEIKHGLTNGYLHPLSFSKKNNCVHTVSEKKDKS